MSFLTLNQKGQLTTSDTKQDLSNVLPIDYISDFIRARVYKQSYVGIKPTSPGDRFVIIKAGTGTGKSTAIPARLWEDHKDLKTAIICTQPRVVNANKFASDDIPRFYPFMKLRENLGFKTMARSIIPQESNNLMYVTVETLNQILKNNVDGLSKYHVIIIDEVHERSVETDNILLTLKTQITRNFLQKKPVPMVLLMSATISEKKYQQYFNIPESNLMYVKGANYPVTIEHAKYDVQNIIEYVIDKVREITQRDDPHIQTSSGKRILDIMIFVNGGKMIEDIIKRLDRLNVENLEANPNSDTIIDRTQLPTLGGDNDSGDNGDSDDEKGDDEKTTNPSSNLSGGWQNDNDNRPRRGNNDNGYQDKRPQHAVPAKIYKPINEFFYPIPLDRKNFDDIKGIFYKSLFQDIATLVTRIETKNGIVAVKPRRKIIVSTNIAETGITLPELGYVIDTGISKSVDYIHELNGRLSLNNKPISMFEAMQRKGRVGRVAPGIYFTCFTQDTWNNLNIEKIPAIVSDDVSNLILSLIIDNLGVVQRLKSEGKFSSAANSNIGFTLGHLDYVIEPTIIPPELKDGVQHEDQTASTVMNFVLDLSTLDFMDKPTATGYCNAYEKLYYLGFTHMNLMPTSLGFFANKIALLTPEQKRMIFASYEHRVKLETVISLISCIRVEHMVSSKFKARPFVKKFGGSEWLKIFEMCQDDNIGKLILFQIIMGQLNARVDSIVKVNKFCDDNDISLRSFMTIIDDRNKLVDSLLELNFSVDSEYMEMDVRNGDHADIIMRLKHVLYDSYICSVLRYDDDDKQYHLLKNNTAMQVSTDIPGYRDLQRPRWLLATAIKCEAGTTNFELTAESISVLDNWVNPDPFYFD